MKATVHTRNISIESFDLGDQHILVEGSLSDTMPRARQSKDWNKIKLVHGMVIRLKVKYPEMRIVMAEAEMPHYPREECPKALASFRSLEGLQITPGYGSKVKDAIGGVKGCAHLTSLVLAMGEAAVQGYRSAYLRDKTRKGPDESALKIINTCHVWKEDGTVVKGLAKP
jgi:hypothetical protein